MKRYLLISMVSAALGAALSQLGGGSDPTPAVVAQEGQRAPVVVVNGAPPNHQAVPVVHFTPEEQVNIRVYENANRSVVNINTKSVRNDNIFFLEIPSEGAGSGSVLDKQGHILTNHHVVEGAQQIEVTLASGKTYSARFIGHDIINDVAVLKIEAPSDELFPITFGDSATLRVGQKVYAIGNPFGLERTLTTGIISSLNRTLPSQTNHRQMKSIIQIDAAMNPGNSGGPLLDTSSRVIGMNTAIASSTGQNSGVGFAIPVNRIKRIVPQLIEQGRVTRPDLGITRVMETEKGLLVATLASGGPAEQAGLRGFRIVRRQSRQGLFTYETRQIDRSTADLITGIDGHPVRTVDDLLSYIEEKTPGEQVTLAILREGQPTTLTVQLAPGE